jgi:protein KRI1
MKHLHDYWNDPNISEGERFLRDYILNKRYLEKSDDEDDEFDGEEDVKTETDKMKKSKDVTEDTQPLDYVDFSEEEKIIENQEQFERKFNFRYEEPDPEFIKSYPRTIEGSMRRKDTKRKEKREEYKQRKELEKQKKKEEIKRLKSFKRKEIMEKLEKIKKITGNHDLKLDVDDLDKDFDSEEYEKKMEKIFNDEFYQQEDPELDQRVDEDGKPIFSDDDDDLKIGRC